MLVDVIDTIGPRIVAFSGKKERRRLGSTARFLHLAITSARNTELGLEASKNFISSKRQKKMGYPQYARKHVVQ